MKNKNMNIKSYTSIDYKNLLLNNSFSKNTNTNLAKIDTHVEDMPKNYEEVNDYSFLNVITEEITNLEAIYDSGELKEILKGSLVDIHNNIYESITSKEINNIIDNLNTSYGKVLLHSVENISYLEIVDQVNDNSYKLQLSHEGYAKIDNNGLDNILTYLIENNNYKG